MPSTLRIVKVKPQSFWERKKNLPFTRPEKPFKAPYKIHVMVDDREYVSSKNPMDIMIEPGKRKIKISDKNFKFAAIKNFLGDAIALSNLGDQDAYLVGEFLKWEANEVLSIKGADICFEENKTLIIYVVNYGNGLNIVEVEEE